MTSERESNTGLRAVSNTSSRQRISRRSFLAAGTAVLSGSTLAQSAGDLLGRFMRIPTQYIAALGNPDSSSGENAHSWGLWRLDPGPRGVRVHDYEHLAAAGGVAPAGWKFDSTDWWFEEHGLIMEQPEFPIPPGKYVVTGGRAVTTVLTVHPRAGNGQQRWELDDDATIYDVTHLRCRSARYTPASPGSCSPDRAHMSDFPVAPGAVMPDVEGCNRQDYSVLIVIGMA